MGRLETIACNAFSTKIESQIKMALMNESEKPRMGAMVIDDTGVIFHTHGFE